MILAYFNELEVSSVEIGFRRISLLFRTFAALGLLLFKNEKPVEYRDRVTSGDSALSLSRPDLAFNFNPSKFYSGSINLKPFLLRVLSLAIR